MNEKPECTNGANFACYSEHPEEGPKNCPMKTDFNIADGLCVGHNALFPKHADAPTTVLLAQDRVFGHNPAVGLYLSNSYSRKLLRKE